MENAFAMNNVTEKKSSEIPSEESIVGWKTTGAVRVLVMAECVARRGSQPTDRPPRSGEAPLVQLCAV